MKRWRERRGVSVRELARRIAIDPGSVLLLEAGQQEPRYDHLRRIARALDLRVSVQFAPKKSPAHH